MGAVEIKFESFDDMASNLAKLTAAERRRAPTWNERQAAAARLRKRGKAIAEGHRKRKARLKAEKKKPATEAQRRGVAGMHAAKKGKLFLPDRILMRMQPGVWYTKWELEDLMGFKRDWIGALLYGSLWKTGFLRKMRFGGTTNGGRSGKKRWTAFAMTRSGRERRERALAIQAGG